MTTPLPPMQPISVEQSIAGAGYKGVTDWRNSYSNTTERVFKQITSEVAYTGLMIFSGLETLARAVMVLYTKVRSNYYNDDQEKKAYIKEYLVPRGQNLLFCASVTRATAGSLVHNITEPNVDGNTILNNEMTYLMTTHKGLLNSLGFRIP